METIIFVVTLIVIFAIGWIWYAKLIHDCQKCKKHNHPECENNCIMNPNGIRDIYPSMSQCKIRKYLSKEQKEKLEQQIKELE